MRFQFRLVHLMWFVFAVGFELGLFRWAPHSMFAGHLAIAIWCGLSFSVVFVGEAARQATVRALDLRWPDAVTRSGVAHVVKQALAFAWALLVAIVLWIALLAMLISTDWMD